MNRKQNPRYPLLRLGLRLILPCLTVLSVYGQDEKMVEWINVHAIGIEDARPDTDPSAFRQRAPKAFVTAKVFGFGEATHHGKEFFDVKAKFFRYLVENQGVKTFIMEESLPAEAGINEWISGGQGDAETIVRHFSIVPWYCREVAKLLEWMRTYNLGRPPEDQIRFYGMDIQNVAGINAIIRHFVSEQRISIDERLLATVDVCASTPVDYSGKTNLIDGQLPDLQEVRRILLDAKQKRTNGGADFDSAIRALDYLIKYIQYVQHPYPQERDLKMFENVKWIVDQGARNGKVFIWAHNEHINAKGFGHYNNRDIYNLGRYLKEYYKADYYSVGFDFGAGTVRGYVHTSGGTGNWTTYALPQPAKGTYSETLFKANAALYFIDLSDAVETEKTGFFQKKKLQMTLGGPGYNPNHDNLYTKRYAEMFDGLIFVRTLSVPDYLPTGY